MDQKEKNLIFLDDICLLEESTDNIDCINNFMERIREEDQSQEDHQYPKFICNQQKILVKQGIDLRFPVFFFTYKSIQKYQQLQKITSVYEKLGGSVKKINKLLKQQHEYEEIIQERERELEEHKIENLDSKQKIQALQVDIECLKVQNVVLENQNKSFKNIWESYQEESIKNQQNQGRILELEEIIQIKEQNIKLNEKLHFEYQTQSQTEIRKYQFEINNLKAKFQQIPEAHSQCREKDLKIEKISKDNEKLRQQLEEVQDENKINRKVIQKQNQKFYKLSQENLEKMSSSQLNQYCKSLVEYIEDTRQQTREHQQSIQEYEKKIYRALINKTENEKQLILELQKANSSNSVIEPLKKFIQIQHRDFDELLKENDKFKESYTSIVTQLTQQSVLLRTGQKILHNQSYHFFK